MRINQWSSKSNHIMDDDVFYSITPKCNLFSSYYDVYTSGENNCLSLGNPLGTTKRKLMSFDTEQLDLQNFNVTDISIGPNSTIYYSKLGRNFFVSGKFGDQHFITPKLVRTEEPVVCAAVGSAHLIICCEKEIYAIGDNSSNQLGYGPGQKFVSQFRARRLADIFPETGQCLQFCATSKNHTILQTDSEFLVSGTNCGQMGPYATRTFNQPLGPPKLFTRLLAPDDSLNKQKFVKIALADDITVLYVGSRAKIFFEYSNYGFSLENGQIQQISICKPNMHVGTTRLIVWTTAAELFIWTKNTGKHLRNPVWSFANAFPKAGFSFRDHFVEFTCSMDGEFFFVHRSIAYSGTFSTHGCEVQRLKDSPGFIEKVFISSSGRNVAFLVKKPIYYNKSLISNKRRQNIPKRLELFTRAQLTSSADISTLHIKAAKRKFTVHRHIIRARVPALSSPLHRPDNNLVSLDAFSDEIVEAMLEWLYTGNCHLFELSGTNSWKSYELGTSQVLNDYHCGICGKFCRKDCDGETTNSKANFCAIWQEFIAETIDRGIENWRDINERRLKRLANLADRMALTQLREHVEIILRYLNELDTSGHNCQLTTNFAAEKNRVKKPFIHPHISAEHIFADQDENLIVRLCCTDGNLLCSKFLLCSSVPYFEAFYRWNEDDRPIDIELTGFSLETAEIFVKFLISHSLDDFKLSMEQLIRLFVFADRYGVSNLMDSVVDLIRENLHLDELADICKLADAFFCPYLDDVLAEFLLAHLSFIFDSYHIVHSIPERVSQLLSNKLRENFAANHQLPSSSPVLEENNEESEPELAAASPILEANDEESEPGSTLFIDYANDLLEALSNRQMNTTELARFLSTSCNRRRRKVEHRRKSNSVSDTADEPNQLILLQEPKVEKGKPSRHPSNESSFELEKPSTSNNNEIDHSQKKAHAEYSKRREEPEKTEAQEPTIELNNNVIKSAPIQKEQLHLSWASPGASPTVKIIPLDQVMVEEQRQMQRHSKAQQKLTTSRAKHKTFPMEIPNKGHRSRGDTPAWGSSASPKSPPPLLVNIQEDELHEIQEAEALPKFKPVQLLEIEERAIQELKDYYEGLFEEDTVMIRVSRVEEEGSRARMAAERMAPKWIQNGKGKNGDCQGR